jgi:hypothetical protein
MSYQTPSHGPDEQRAAARERADMSFQFVHEFMNGLDLNVATREGVMAALRAGLGMYSGLRDGLVTQVEATGAFHYEVPYGPYAVHFYVSKHAEPYGNGPIITVTGGNPDGAIEFRDTDVDEEREGIRAANRAVLEKLSGAQGRFAEADRAEVLGFLDTVFDAELPMHEAAEDSVHAPGHPHTMRNFRFVIGDQSVTLWVDPRTTQPVCLTYSTFQEGSEE